jgi:nucleoside-diphosphate-sugar epimerase
VTTVLVTGGSGAIGSNLVREVLGRGWRTVVLDDLSSGHRELLPSDAELIVGAVQSDEDLDRAFAVQPDYVVHLAAMFANQNSVEHPLEDLYAGGVGTLKVLERARAHRIRKILYASSSCVYGHKELMDEADDGFHPDTPYAITKLLGERYGRFFASYHGLNVVIVRLFNCYGPGEYPGRYRNVVPNFFKLAMEGKPLPITGTGDETRDFTYVGDIVRGILGALEGSTPPGGVFNLASGEHTRIIDLAHLINEIAGNRAGVEFQARRAWDTVVNRRATIRNAARCFGFSPTIGLREGLTRTHEWLKSVYA